MGYSRGISYPLVGSIPCRPPRVRTITFISQPPHLLYGVRVALDFFLSCRVVRPKSALYEVSVRRPETLPVLALLSLHIRLPSDPTSRWAPLPSASGSCYRVRSGLSPPSYRPCRAHSQKGPVPVGTGPLSNEALTRFAGTLPDLGFKTRFARTGRGNEFFPSVARKRVCAGKTFAGFSCTIPISPPQRPIFACDKNGKAPKKGL